MTRIITQSRLFIPIVIPHLLPYALDQHSVLFNTDLTCVVSMNFNTTHTHDAATALFYCISICWATKSDGNLHYINIKRHVTQPDTHPDSLHTGPVHRQRQHTDCIYGHHTALHEHYNNRIILAISL